MPLRNSSRELNLRERLIDSAVELLGSSGYKDVTIENITDKAGVTKGSFYYYFTDKESLLYLIHDTFISYELQLAQEAYKNLKGPEAKLVQFIRDLLQSIALFKPYVTIFFRDRNYLSEDSMTKIKQKRDEYEGILVQILNDGKHEGVFHFTDSKIVAKGIFGMCNWVYQWYRDSGERSMLEIADEFVGVIKKGIL